MYDQMLLDINLSKYGSVIQQLPATLGKSS